MHGTAEGVRVRLRAALMVAATAGMLLPWGAATGRADTRGRGSEGARAPLAALRGSPLSADAPRRARVGVYYFDGWGGPLNSNHFQGLVDGPFRDRMPLSGWQDNTLSAMRAQLAWAHQDGIEFFVFDWYHNPEASPFPYLNNALHEYRSLGDHHGVRFALLYVNNEQWAVPAAEWKSVVEQWVTDDFADPDYVRINGKPLLVILDVGWMHRTFGGPGGVSDALEVLRQTARAHGLPGVFVVGGAQVSRKYPDIEGQFVSGVPYDALTTYAYIYTYDHEGRVVPGSRPYGDLVQTAQTVWSIYALHSPLPYIPVVMSGWDPRPWKEEVAGQVFWFERTVDEFGRFVCEAIAWAASHPRLRAEPPPAPPLLFIYAWNELGEGGYLVPTLGDGNRYGDVLARALHGECSQIENGRRLPHRRSAAGGPRVKPEPGGRDPAHGIR